MADKVAAQKDVEATAAEEVVDNKAKVEEAPAVAATEDDSKSENGASENGEPVEKENGKEDDSKNGDDDAKAKVCSIKRKSAGGDAPDGGAPAEGATPEKKAKLDDAAAATEAAAAESNVEAEVAA